MPRTIALAFLIAFTSLGGYGQGTVAPPSFEVASVRPKKTGLRGGSMEFSKGGESFTATNMPLGAFVLVAYNLTVRQLSGGSGFLSAPYDIRAKAEHPVSPNEMLRMLQALLVDRFKMFVRRETREVPVYALTVGKRGPRLHASPPVEGEAPTPRTPSRAGGTEPRGGRLIFKHESMADFAWALSRMGGLDNRVVVDDTRLAGNYDFELSFDPDRAPPAGPDGLESAPHLDRPTLFSAIEEQLGLELVSKKAPVEFLIIEHVERPSEN